MPPALADRLDGRNYEWMKEYLVRTNARQDMRTLPKLEMAQALGLVNGSEYGGYRAKNFAVLMFADRPQDFGTKNPSPVPPRSTTPFQGQFTWDGSVAASEAPPNSASATVASITEAPSSSTSSLTDMSNVII